jgi:hypothetical protein
MITKEQLKHEIDTVENREVLALIYQLIQTIKKPVIIEKSVKKHSKSALEKAMAEFCGVFDDLAIDSVENTLRLHRKGRRRLWDDI